MYPHPTTHLHALGGVCEHQARPKGLQQDAPLEGHAGRHGQHEVVAAGSSDKGEPDARVAAGGLDERGGARCDEPLCFCVEDHLHSDAVLDALAGCVEGLELGGDTGAAAIGDGVEVHQGGVADEVDDGLGDWWSWLCGWGGGCSVECGGYCGGVRGHAGPPGLADPRGIASGLGATAWSGGRGEWRGGGLGRTEPHAACRLVSVLLDSTG